MHHKKTRILFYKDIRPQTKRCFVGEGVGKAPQPTPFLYSIACDVVCILLLLFAQDAHARPTCACDAYRGPFTTTAVVQDYLARYSIAYIKMLPTVKPDKPCDLPMTRLRVSKKAGTFYTGDIIKVRYKMQCAGQAVVPHGFNYTRWLEERGMNAIGFAYGLPQRVGHTGEPRHQLFERLEQWRERVTAFVHTHAGNTQAAATAIALLTGDRQYIDDNSLRVMRASGLAHLLAISGLHMALVGGLAFWLVQQGSALTPLAARYSMSRPAALVGWLACLGYLAITGGAVSATRAFVMASLVFLAILTHRKAISFWTLALAAVAVLCLNPSYMFDVGFQLSFMATAALIAYFQAYTRAANHATPLWQQPWHYWQALFISGVWVFLATAPIVAYHFQRVPVMSPLANLIAIPLTGFVVMPFLVASVILWPLGLGEYPLRVALWGIEGILATANASITYGYSDIALPSMPDSVFMSLMLLVAAAFIVPRWYKALPMVAAALIAVWWLRQPLPVYLLTPSGQTLAHYDAASNTLTLHYQRRLRFEHEVLITYFAHPATIIRNPPSPSVVWQCLEGACTLTAAGVPPLRYTQGGWHYTATAGWQPYE